MTFVSADVGTRGPNIAKWTGKRQPMDVEGVSAHDNFLAIIQGCTFYFAALVDFKVCYAETEHEQLNATFI